MSLVRSVFVALVVVVGCGGTATTPSPAHTDADVILTFDSLPAPNVTAVADAPDGNTFSDVAPACPGGSGCPCLDNAECASTVCIEDSASTTGKSCTQSCVVNCPDGHSCAQISSPGGDLLSICVPRWGHLCDPCGISGQCQAPGVPGAACVDQGAQGRFCGAPCQSDGDCPGSYGCRDVISAEQAKVRQCVRLPGDKTAMSPGTCPCSEHATATKLTTACTISGSTGACSGIRTCTAAGLSECIGPPASAEVCNGIDDDCNGKTDEATCDDGNPCTTDGCDRSAGACSHVAAPGSCDADANACTVGDECIEGKCTAGKVKNCDDGNPCTVDACNPAIGCTSTQDDGAPCNDEDGCTLGDVCKGGACQPGVSKVCANNGPCIVNVCQSATGQCSSSNSAEGQACDDGSACTKGDSCSSGSCVGSAVECDDANPCTMDSCEKASGCVHKASAVPCDDGNACTDADTCQGGACVGTPKDAAKGCADGTLCTTDSCDPTAGCVHAANTLPCDDGNVCTNGDTCKDKQCTPGTSTCACNADADCAKEDDGNLCNGSLFCDKSSMSYKCKVNPATVVTCSTSGDTACSKAECNAITGKCGAKAQADGTGCDADGSVCTISDACADGVCKAGSGLSCDDSNPCTNDSCDATTGCVHGTNSAPCDADNSFCTENDICKGSNCVPGPKKYCNDGNPCTSDSCDTKSGCMFDANTATCDDGSACTAGDACATGKCIAGKPVSCDDGNQCTLDSCDSNFGCVSVPATATCTDGDSCTLGDKCSSGSCVAGSPSCALGDGCQSNLDCKIGKCVQGVCAPFGTCGPVPFLSNGKLGDLFLSQNAVLDTDKGTITTPGGQVLVAANAPGTQVIIQENAVSLAPDLFVMQFKNFSIVQGVSLQIRGSRAAAILATGTIAVAGFLDASGQPGTVGVGGQAGAGGGAGSDSCGYQCGCPVQASGIGAGMNGECIEPKDLPTLGGNAQQSPKSGGGGGGGCGGSTGGGAGHLTPGVSGIPRSGGNPGGAGSGVGAVGGKGCNPGSIKAAGGPAYGNADLIPLQGGSGGGAGRNGVGGRSGGYGKFEGYPGPNTSWESGAVMGAYADSTYGGLGAGGGGGGGALILCAASLVETKGSGKVSVDGGAGGSGQSMSNAKSGGNACYAADYPSWCSVGKCGGGGGGGGGGNGAGGGGGGGSGGGLIIVSLAVINAGVLTAVGSAGNATSYVTSGAPGGEGGEGCQGSSGGQGGNGGGSETYGGLGGSGAIRILGSVSQKGKVLGVFKSDALP
jgi:hypothetical protein